MRSLLIGLVFLAGCAGRPPPVKELVHVVCPAVEPQILCPMVDMDARPEHPFQLQGTYLHVLEALECRDSLIRLWQVTYMDCAEPQ